MNFSDECVICKFRSIKSVNERGHLVYTFVGKKFSFYEKKKKKWKNVSIQKEPTKGLQSERIVTTQAYH